MTDESREIFLAEISPRQDPMIDVTRLSYLAKFITFSMFAAAVKNNMTHKGEDIYRSTKNVVMVLHWWSLSNNERAVYSQWITENDDKGLAMSELIRLIGTRNVGWRVKLSDELMAEREAEYVVACSKFANTFADECDDDGGGHDDYTANLSSVPKNVKAQTIKNHFNYLNTEKMLARGVQKAMYFLNACTDS